TLWLDVARRDWSDALLGACEMTRAQMPRIVEGNAPSGTLRADVARVLGLSEAVVVAGGGGDNATSALGIGAIHAGDGFVSLGTSGVLSVVGDRFTPNPASAVHAFCH
ncbi:xylulokinase, partial [Burkholderia sp. TJI49]